jgi:hypothetical protein
MVVVGTPGGKSPPGRPELRWEDNVRMGFQEDVDGLIRLGIGTKG